MLTCGLHGIMDDKRCDIQYPVFLLAIALTGLTWSFAWYRTGFYALCGVEQQADGGHGRQEGRQDISSSGRRGGHGANEPDGAYRHAEGGEDSHRGHGYHGGGHRDGAYADHDGDGFGGHHRRSPYRHWQNLLEEAQKQHPGYRQITLKPGTLEVVPEGRRSLRAADKYEYDRRSGEITATRAYADEDRSVKVRSAVYTVHTGSWGGWLTRLVTFLAALLGASLPLTGYYLWIRRLLRKRKSEGQPAAVRPSSN